MTSEQIKNLALSLLAADSEEEVIWILKNHSFWDAPAAWRLYGDRDGNFSIIGNQQSRPEAALVEKIVNAVDARLMNECLVRGIDPTSDAAPPTIRHAIARFFEGRDVMADVGGLIQEWPQDRQLRESQLVTVAVTGAKPPGNPSITVSDQGEGQTPNRMPDTFLSLDRDNKLRIPFVQGKFNMGGTGALKFCGNHSLQLIISRRNPAIVGMEGDDDDTSSQWGVTVVRREHPHGTVGAVRNSVFKYLAPVGATEHPGKGQVLSFEPDGIQAMPDGNTAYKREMQWGSLIKLYEYDLKGSSSHALRPDGLLFRLELLLPGIALPVRVHECRAYRGHKGSFANTLVGLSARLSENRAENLESGYPTSVPFTVRGEHMVAQLLAFKPGKADSYRKNEAIVFTINGQTHGALPKPFFSRTSVKMGRLATSLLVLVDCSKLSVVAREDLFMNSRDRLSNGALRKAIETELEELIGKHPGLRELRDRRRSEEIAHRLKDSRPMEEVLDSILKSSPTLARLFLLGQRLTRPHRARSNGSGLGGDGDEEGKGRFKGHKHPSFFRFYRHGDSDVLSRDCELGRRCRIKFETDVENDYFSRPLTPGRYHVDVIEGPLVGAFLDHSLTLHCGIANWSISLPGEYLRAGDELTLECTVTDDTLTEPFVNVARLTVRGRADREGSPDGRREERHVTPLERPGGGRGSSDPGGISMPTVVRVRENDENWDRHKFDGHTACRVMEDAALDDEEQSVFTFYINVDNLALRNEMKGARENVLLTEAKFVYGNVLVGLALIYESRSNGKSFAPLAANEGEDQINIEALVDGTTRALAPFLVPMIDYLGALSDDEVAGLSEAGDDE